MILVVGGRQSPIWPWRRYVTFSRAASQTLVHARDALPEHAALPFLFQAFQYLLDACTILSIDRLYTK